MRTAPHNRNAAPGQDRAPDRASAMATALVKATRAKGEASRDDLIRAGFTPAEIDRHGDQARAIAAGRLGGEL